MKLNTTYTNLTTRFTLYSILWTLSNGLFLLMMLIGLLNAPLFFIEGSHIRNRCIGCGSLCLGIFYSILLFKYLKFLSKSFTSFLYCHKIPMARMNYKQLKTLIDCMSEEYNFEYTNISYYYQSYTVSFRYAIFFKDIEICGSLFCYFAMVCSHYSYITKQKLKVFFQKIGINYFTEKEEKIKFNKTMNQNTQIVIQSMLTEIEKKKQRNTI